MRLRERRGREREERDRGRERERARERERELVPGQRERELVPSSSPWARTGRFDPGVPSIPAYRAPTRRSPTRLMPAQGTSRSCPPPPLAPRPSSIMSAPPAHQKVERTFAFASLAAWVREPAMRQLSRGRLTAAHRQYTAQSAALPSRSSGRATPFCRHTGHSAGHCWRTCHCH